MRIEIRNGRVIDPATNRDEIMSLFVADGIVAGVGRSPAGFSADRTIDATGLVVCPGLIDLAARVANNTAELRAAVAGGITSACCPPDTNPPLDEPGLVEQLVSRSRALRLARVHPLGALTVGLRGQALSELVDLAQAGCIAFTQADSPLASTELLYRSMQYASTFDLRVWMHPEDPFLAAVGVAHDGEVASRLGLPGIPACAESIALHTLLVLARDTGVRLHVSRLSTAAGVEMVRAAKRAGQAVTADAAIHHLHLCDADIGYFDSRARLSPPLRAAPDRDALQQGAADGTLDALCSDHTAVGDDGKQLPFAEAEVGATGLELLLPLTLAWASDRSLPLSMALRRVTCDAATIAGLPAGRIAEGAAADLCIFDPAGGWTVGQATLVSRSSNTPFFGETLRGRVRMTLVDGRVVHEDVVAPERHSAA